MKKTAFVLMPFGGKFDAVYEYFFEPCLRDAGFEVVRADQVASQQSITKDIIGLIDTSDLIVADLTDGNPNVYYELGVAHAARRDVILLTQSHQDTPFDLKAYRAIKYGTDLVEVEQAKKELSSLLQAVVEGKVEFGSPVTDYGEFGSSPRPLHESDELGLLDYSVQLEDALHAINVSATAIGGEITEIGADAKAAAEPMIRASASPKEQRKILGNLAARFSKGSVSIDGHTEKYRAALAEMKTAAKHVLGRTDYKIQNEKELEEAKRLRATLDTLPANLETGLGGVRRLTSTIDGLPNLERRFNQSKVRLVKSLDGFDRALVSTGPVFAEIAGYLDAALSKYEAEHTLGGDE